MPERAPASYRSALRMIALKALDYSPAESMKFLADEQNAAHLDAVLIDLIAENDLFTRAVRNCLLLLFSYPKSDFGYLAGIYMEHSGNTVDVEALKKSARRGTDRLADLLRDRVRIQRLKKRIGVPLTPRSSPYNTERQS